MSELAGSLVLMGVFLFFSAAFSCAETAFMSLSRLQLARLRKAHPGRLDFWEKDPDRVLGVVLLGNSLTNVGLGVIATSLALQAQVLWGLPFRWGGWIIPAAMAVGVILFGEIVPKVLARNHSEGVALALAGPVHGLTRFFGPVLEGLLEKIGDLLSWLSRTIQTERAEWNSAVIRSLLQMSPLPSRLKSVLNNLLDFGSLPVSTVMAPVHEIVALDMSLPKEEFVRRVLSSGYSRVPVYRGALENLQGIVYAKDLLSFWRNESLLVMQDLVRPALRVPGTTKLADLLREFRQGRHHLALVGDSSGRVVGLITLQDVLEAIVGEIAEEPDVAPARGGLI